MGEDRIKKFNRLEVKAMLRGHNNTVAHAWRHTDGKCPKCASTERMSMFCRPGDGSVPYVRGCELEGDHLHIICRCGYLWVERCWDQAMAAAEAGALVAEGEAAMMLAALAHDQGGVRFDEAHIASYQGWILRFEREDGMVILTAEPPEVQVGQIRHPQSEEDHVSP